MTPDLLRRIRELLAALNLRGELCPLCLYPRPGEHRNWCELQAIQRLLAHQPSNIS